MTSLRSIRSADVERLSPGGSVETRADEVAVEEPLEIRISGETLAITMRTPGNDRELVLGFLIAEGVISSASDVASVVHCGRTTDEGRENTIDVTLAPGVKPPVDAETGMLARRGTLVTSACGVCGRRSIEDLLARTAPLADGGRVSPEVIAAAVRRLRERQPIFARTGGCHAASLVTFDGRHVATFEDVGRHNAVDKVVGARVLAGALPLSEHLLVASGRSSFEIVQKALSAGIPLVASVSAPSSLAVDLARRANVTLAGFVRDGTMTFYSGRDRLSS
ncbi:MAG: formate dehydrogenase accessory sulfurtransferase FdhD [Myxococcales bacterium]|nr:formate dehydrogenase accessory sulfurtransferase FdhD [Myxococcales bacterium]